MKSEFSAGPAREWYNIISELATLCLGLWVASRFLWKGDFPAILYGEVGLLWIASTWVITRGALPGGTVYPHLSTAVKMCGLAAVGVVIRAQCRGVTGLEAAGIALMMASALYTSRKLVFAFGSRPSPGDGVRGAVVQGVAIFCISPYARSAQVGAGDYYQYGLMLADFIKQVRAGVFPVLIGQSEFSLNGSFHTLRTAPFYEYAGGILQLLTLGVLSVNAVQNLTLVACAWAGALGAFGALRRYTPNIPTVAAGLASLYILCPGVLAPLFQGDMVATFMVVPLIPWWLLGLVQSLDEPRSRTPWLLQGTALSAMWWAHPPVAIWATGLTGSFILVNLGTANGRVYMLPGLIEGAAIFGVLSCFVFVSVWTLALPRVPGLASAVMQSIHESWWASLHPVVEGPGTLLSNIQLGYPLAVFSFCGLLAMKRRSVRFLLLGIVGFLALLFPLPVATAWIWNHVSPAVISVTNRWPMQRFYVLLAGLSIFGGAAGLSHLATKRRTSVVVVTALIAALIWSGHEARKLMEMANASTTSRSRSEMSMRWNNIVTSYALYVLGSVPPVYFSNAPMSPVLECRLFDRESWSWIGDGSTPVETETGPSHTIVNLLGGNGFSRFKEGIKIAKGCTGILRFDFLGQLPRGQLELEGPTLSALFNLPSSGNELAFGAAGANRRVLAIANDSGADETIHLSFSPSPGYSPSTPLFARVAVEEMTAVERTVQLRSMIPLRLITVAPKASVLETPRVFIPGYEATVNGAQTAVIETEAGFAAIKVPAGRSEVQLTYRGSLGLRVAFWASLAGWLCVAFVAARQKDRDRGRIFVLAGAAEVWIGTSLSKHRKAIGVLVVAVSAILLVWRNLPAPSGLIRMTVMLPWGPHAEAQPLISVGRVGAAEIFYLQVLGPTTIRLGLDNWGHHPVLSSPFEVDFDKPQSVVIAMSSNPNAESSASPVTVLWNGKLVLSDAVLPRPFGRHEIYPGANPMGATSCGPRFKGRILVANR